MVLFDVSRRLDEVTHLEGEQLGEFLRFSLGDSVFNELSFKLPLGSLVAQAVVQCPSGCPNYQSQNCGNGT